MGVQSLWQLLHPVGRPVLLETMEGKRMAIDSSIWIYQFQATMRDSQGHALLNAHVLGFLRRITKLLFYGIKPVFVFDGGAPVLKRTTILERKRKKLGAATSHAKIAEKLLAAHMRREAVKQSSKQKASSSSTVFYEDIDPKFASITVKTPSKDTSSPSNKNASRINNDPYHLPEVDLNAAISRVSQSSAPDPRLATEEELRVFIQEMKPEDFDVNSETFRELPTEVQYEIIGDLRLKSRQTSYIRLQNMLRSSRTPMDFSKQQIANLKQRNNLTQQLLTTTDDIGRAHITIPVRIASERNKEYVLIKNDGPTGGWILGIHDDTGTSKDRPIEIDPMEQNQALPSTTNEDDDDMEEVEIPNSKYMDPDLLPSTEGGIKTTNSHLQSPQRSPYVYGHSFDSEEPKERHASDGDDPELALAIQASIDENSAYFVEDTRLATALSIAGAGPSRSRFFEDTSSASFPAPQGSPHTPRKQASIPSPFEKKPINTTESPFSKSYSFGTPSFAVPATQQETKQATTSSQPLFLDDDDLDDMNMEPVPIPDSFPLANQRPIESSTTTSSTHTSHIQQQVESPSTDSHDMASPLSYQDDPNSPPATSIAKGKQPLRHLSPVGNAVLSDDDLDDMYAPESPSVPLEVDPTLPEDITMEDSSAPAPVDADILVSTTLVDDDDGWDAAQEMDPRMEEGDFAQFLSEVKGKDLGEVQREIDAEITELRHRQKQAIRDSEDVNSQMVAQIMTLLRLFGIPYITAPMEAEAQCAELVDIGLVDGVITDDSDVFLFGAHRVFKNMFNQSKTVECFLLTDLSRELGLDRDTLVRLAYLLGSDYTEGLPGVGPVLAMELLKEFPGEDGLHQFKSWWTQVQSGKDNKEETNSAFKKRFKKRFKDLYLDSNWPNPTVRDAYYHPVVDNSEEPFKWGLPDLDALRSFCRSEFGWKQEKVDDLLLPTISKMGKRNQPSSITKQGNLNNFFDISAGSGTFAPRNQQVYSSKRLQQVISDFRQSKRVRSSDSEEVNSDDADTGREGEDRSQNASMAKKRKTSTKGKKGTSKKTGSSNARRKSKKTLHNDTSDGSTDDYREEGNIPDKPLEIRLRPKPKPRTSTKN